MVAHNNNCCHYFAADCTADKTMSCEVPPTNDSKSLGVISTPLNIIASALLSQIVFSYSL